MSWKTNAIDCLRGISDGRDVIESMRDANDVAKGEINLVNIAITQAVHVYSALCAYQYTYAKLKQPSISNRQIYLLSTIPLIYHYIIAKEFSTHLTAVATFLQQHMIKVAQAITFVAAVVLIKNDKKRIFTVSIICCLVFEKFLQMRFIPNKWAERSEKLMDFLGSCGSSLPIKNKIDIFMAALRFSRYLPKIATKWPNYAQLNFQQKFLSLPLIRSFAIAKSLACRSKIEQEFILRKDEKTTLELQDLESLFKDPFSFLKKCQVNQGHYNYPVVRTPQVEPEERVEVEKLEEIWNEIVKIDPNIFDLVRERGIKFGAIDPAEYMLNLIKSFIEKVKNKTVLDHYSTAYTESVEESIVLTVSSFWKEIQEIKKAQEIPQQDNPESDVVSAGVKSDEWRSSYYFLIDRLIFLLKINVCSKGNISDFIALAEGGDQLNYICKTNEEFVSLFQNWVWKQLQDHREKRFLNIYFRYFQQRIENTKASLKGLSWFPGMKSILEARDKAVEELFRPDDRELLHPIYEDYRETLGLSDNQGSKLSAKIFSPTALLMAEHIDHLLKNINNANYPFLILFKMEMSDALRNCSMRWIKNWIKQTIAEVKPKAGSADNQQYLKYLEQLDEDFDDNGGASLGGSNIEISNYEYLTHLDDMVRLEKLLTPEEYQDELTIQTAKSKNPLFWHLTYVF